MSFFRVVLKNSYVRVQQDFRVIVKCNKVIKKKSFIYTWVKKHTECEKSSHFKFEHFGKKI